MLDYEKEFNIKLDDGILNGYIDRVNLYKNQIGERVLQIIDYKYSYKNYTKGEIDKLLQLRIYRYAAIKELYKNCDIIQLGIYNVRYNYIRYGEEVKVDTLSKELESMENFLNEKWKEIKIVKEYPCIKSSACNDYGGCQVMIEGKCPAFSKEEVDKILKSDDIIEQVKIVRALKSQVKNATEKLKEHFENNAPIEVDGEMVGFIVKMSCKYFISAMLKLKEKYGVNIDSLTISKTEAEKIMKKHFGKKIEEIISELKEDIINTSSNSFEI